VAGEVIDMSDRWLMAVHALEKGDFSRLETILGGPEAFDRQIIEWYDDRQFDETPELLAEALTCACMLGRTEMAKLFDRSRSRPVRGYENVARGSALRG